jgi:hypothetical protein
MTATKYGKYIVTAKANQERRLGFRLRLTQCWGRGDSNPHALLHQILSLARLPVPALPRGDILTKLYHFGGLATRQPPAESSSHLQR